MHAAFIHLFKILSSVWNFIHYSMTVLLFSSKVIQLLLFLLRWYSSGLSLVYKFNACICNTLQLLQVVSKSFLLKGFIVWVWESPLYNFPTNCIIAKPFFIQVGCGDCVKDFRSSHIDGPALLSMTVASLRSYPSLSDPAKREYVNDVTSVCLLY